ncbi:MAG: helix-turn-helix transcriptional regulator [Clostridia bacterium]|nr:helix-turn-helix transcriptional regulator [Clostridia bacterium]
MVRNTDLRSVIKKNLNKLMDAKNLSQVELGRIMNITTKSTINNYVNELSDSIPDIISLNYLCTYFGIPMDLFLSPSFSPDSAYEIEGVHIDEYDKFVGIYSLYYITTSKLFTYSTQYSDQPELSFGALAIVKNGGNQITTCSYQAYACFSLKDEAEMADLKAGAELALSRGDNVGVRNLFTEKSSYYVGDFGLLQKGKFYTINLKGYQKSSGDDPRLMVCDNAQLMGFNPDEMGTFLGSGALSSSLSRGMKKSPCAQLVLLSRITLDEYGKQDIMKKLLKPNQNFSTDNATNKIMKRYDELMANPNYPSEDRHILLKSHVNKCILEELTNNCSQLFSLLEEGDQFLYRYLKTYNN